MEKEREGSTNSYAPILDKDVAKVISASSIDLYTCVEKRKRKERKKNKRTPEFACRSFGSELVRLG